MSELFAKKYFLAVRTLSQDYAAHGLSISIQMNWNLYAASTLTKNKTYTWNNGKLKCVLVILYYSVRIILSKLDAM